MTKTALFNTGNHREDLQCILDLINDLHGALDKQTYDDKRHDDYDAPDDREYAVNVTAKQERDLTQAVLLIENALKQPAPEPAAWQHRHIYRDGTRSVWLDCDAEHAELLRRDFPEFAEVRPLYTATA